MSPAVVDRAAERVESVRLATPAEGRALLDRRAQRYLGISGAEFVRRWNAGEYANDPEQPGVMDVAVLLPFWRE
jgi:hypothetical protein